MPIINQFINMEDMLLLQNNSPHPNIIDIVVSALFLGYRCNLNQVSHRYLQPSNSRTRVKTLSTENQQRKIKKYQPKLQTIHPIKLHSKSHQKLQQSNHDNPQTQKQLKLQLFLQNKDFFIKKWQQQSLLQDKKFKQKLTQVSLKPIKIKNKSNYHHQLENITLNNSRNKLKMNQLIRLKTQAFQQSNQFKISPKKKQGTIIKEDYLKSNVQDIIKHLQQSKQQLEKARKMIKKELKSQEKRQLKRQQEKSKQKIIKQIQKQYDLYHERHRQNKLKQYHRDEKQLLSSVKELSQLQHKTSQESHNQGDLYLYTNDSLPIDKKNALSQTDQTAIFNNQQMSLQVKQKQSSNKDMISRQIKITVPISNSKHRVKEPLKTIINHNKNKQVIKLQKQQQQQQQKQQQQQQLIVGLNQNPEWVKNNK